MASAAKRRKAARKKKKELESHITSSNLHENGDPMSENEKDSGGSVQSNSPTSEDHPHLFNEGKEDLKSGESMNKPPESDAVVQIADEMEAGDDLQIERRGVEDGVGEENDGQGSELNSNGILIVKVVEKEETEEESESAGISIERLAVAKESCNEGNENLAMANSQQKLPEVPMIPTVVRRTSWMSCCGLLDVITGSRT
ncbi:hypothetical protein BT93_E1928 [Corymbia citriodora subsp. variegata]|nr:hypothetical protein BT93_E1928 [Corymbia citriodora subsp. variegata]